MKYQKYVFFLGSLVLLLVSGCGGGGSGGTSVSPVPAGQFGSIATQTTSSGVMAVSSGNQTQSLANADAIAKCQALAVVAAQCFVRQEFSGIGQCGAVARGANNIIGWGIGSPISQAEASAVADCKTRGGTSCASIQSQCN